MKILFTSFLTFFLSCSCLAQKYEIFFTHQVNNNDNIYSINEKGELKQITNHPRKDSSPMVSFSGNDMVFTSERVGWWKIWIMNLDNGSTQQLTQSGTAEYSPSWSPNGDQIIFVSGRNGGSEIFRMERNGSKLSQISSGGKNTMPTWGGDNRIYYSNQVAGTYQIMSMNPDGKEVKQITNNEGDKLMPQLSPDLERLLYYGNQDGNMEIYILDLKTKETERLTDHPLMDIRPRWSPDGSLIVFERGNKKDNQHIYLMNTDGSDVKKLTKSGYNYAPSFMPK